MIIVALPIAIVTSWFLFQRGMWREQSEPLDLNVRALAVLGRGGNGFEKNNDNNQKKKKKNRF